MHRLCLDSCSAIHATIQNAWAASRECYEVFEEYIEDEFENIDRNITDMEDIIRDAREAMREAARRSGYGGGGGGKGGRFALR